MSGLFIHPFVLPDLLHCAIESTNYKELNVHSGHWVLHTTGIQSLQTRLIMSTVVIRGRCCVEAGNCIGSNVRVGQRWQLCQIFGFWTPIYASCWGIYIFTFQRKQGLWNQYVLSNTAGCCLIVSILEPSFFVVFFSSFLFLKKSSSFVKIRDCYVKIADWELPLKPPSLPYPLHSSFSDGSSGDGGEGLGQTTGAPFPPVPLSPGLWDEQEVERVGGARPWPCRAMLTRRLFSSWQWCHCLPDSLPICLPFCCYLLSTFCNLYMRICLCI